MVQVAAERGDGTLAFDFLVDEFVAAPARAIAAEKAQAEIRIPIAVRDPAIDEPDFAGKARAGELIAIGAQEESGQTFAQRRRDFLVGIEREDPRMRGEGEGGVLRIAVALPREMMHPCTE